MLKGVYVTAMLGACACITIGGCATIVHGGPRDISVESTPPGAIVHIYDRSNTLVQINTTPFVAKLPTRYGYFKGQRYRVVFELPDHAPAEVNLQSSVSDWYFGNLIFGGLIGMLIVDPLTGAMYNLSPDKVEMGLGSADARLIRSGKGFGVVLASQITERERAAMVRIN